MRIARPTTLAMILLSLIGCSSSNSDPEVSPTSPFFASGGVAPGDPNPGSVPDPVLAELTTINIRDLGGHKVFAGPDQGLTSDFEAVNGYAYFNVDFDCDGTGSFEAFQTEEIAPIFNDVKGTMTWGIDDSVQRLFITATEFTEGSLIGGRDIRVLQLESATDNMIAGRTKITNVAVARIVQYKPCS